MCAISLIIPGVVIVFIWKPWRYHIRGETLPWVYADSVRTKQLDITLTRYSVIVQNPHQIVRKSKKEKHIKRCHKKDIQKTIKALSNPTNEPITGPIQLNNIAIYHKAIVLMYVKYKWDGTPREDDELWGSS